jgi:hypothetical protein
MILWLVSYMYTENNSMCIQYFNSVWQIFNLFGKFLIAPLCITGLLHTIILPRLNLRTNYFHLMCVFTVISSFLSTLRAVV